MHRILVHTLSVLLVAALLVATLLVAAPSSALAQTDQRAVAKRHFKRGKRLSKAKKYRPAIAEFHKAYKHWRHRVILFNIAMCHAWLGNLTVSGTYVRRFLKEARGNERTLPPLLEKVFQATGELTLVAPEPEARLLVDGRQVGTGRATVVVLVGERVLEIRTGNKLRARTRLKIPAGGVARWVPRIKRLVTPIKPRRRPDPGAPPPRRRGGLHWAWMATFTGLAAGLAGGAVAMGLRTMDLKEQFLANRTDASLRSDTLRAQTITNVLWGVAGAALVTAVVLAIFTRWRRADRARPRVQLVPTLGPKGAGVSVTWTP